MIKTRRRREPPAAASFPGLLEVFMRIHAVIMIAGVHDADTTAGRLAVPVPDRSRRVGTIASSALGRGRRQLTPALLGVG